MKTFVCYYFTTDGLEQRSTEIIAASRIDAIDEFEVTHPHGLLVHLREKVFSIDV